MVGWSVVEGDRWIRVWLLVGIVGLALCAAASLAAVAPADARTRLAECADNIDNDIDGRTDFPAEPGCRNPAEQSELNPVPLPACGNGQDDDGSAGEYPTDPGCASAADNSEFSIGNPACANADDNDGDGRTDYPADLGCISASDVSETDTACSRDGLDNDRDGFTDFPADFGCATPVTGPNQPDNDEVDPPQCNDGRDNDGDGKVDFDQTPDPDCKDALDDNEAADPHCSDGIDNDGDGKLDAADPGCSSAADDDEANPPRPACADGLDNDVDGLVDLTDPGCGAASDGDETNVSYSLPPGNDATGTPGGTLLPSGPPSPPPRSPTVTPTLSPFPVIRLAGRAERRATRVTLLRIVQVPAGSKVTVYCSGGPCPRKRVSQSVTRKVGPFTGGGPAVRVRQFERRLKVGISLRIFVTKSGFVGKYTRFKIRRSKPPSREDRCARYAGAKPMPCPAVG